MTFGTRLFTWWCGAPVGEDAFGNRYFHEKRPRDPKQVRRWVLYNGEPEPSKVPPERHAWLHHNDGVPPPAGDPPGPGWQKPHVPNLTRTALAYRPPGPPPPSPPGPPSGGDCEPW